MLDANASLYASYYCDYRGQYSYPKMISWNASTDCCRWDGVTCNHLNGHIIGLDLSCSQIQGTNPPNSSLFHLNHLNLAYNDFFSSGISSEFGLLTSLTHLNLSNSNFQGNIASEISHLSNLISLDLSLNFGCSMMGPINFQMMLQNLTYLRELSLNFVNISSKLPMNLSSTLTHLDLTDAELYGNLPSNVFHLPNIEVLGLGANEALSGSLPEFNCSINGNSITSLFLSFTNLSGILPDSIGCLKSLSYFGLRSSQISGAIPKSVSNLEQLIILDLAQNNLTGKITVSFSNLTNLKLLELSDNQLDGSIPNSIFTLARLHYLDLSRNHFHGIELNMLVDHTNHFNFSLPNLQILGLSSCGIEEFPDFFRNSRSLYELDLSYNKIHGQIPSWFMSKPWDLLYHFNVSHNLLTGTVNQLAFKKLGYLDMSYNLLHGQLPSCICNLSALVVLDLSYNNFYFEIPRCLGSSSRWLRILDLGNNGLFGTIPTAFTKSNQLSILILDNNQLEGPLPRSLANCTELQLLDIENNKIDDKFPIWLETLSQLKVLILKSNRFHGAIGTGKVSSPFPQLRIIDVSCNKLTGLLPLHLLSNFKAMTKLIHFKLKDPYMRFPMYGSYVHSVSLVIKGVEYNFERLSITQVVLDFSSNSFEGEIPEIIGHLHSLQVLNLSHNNLTGHIPRTFGNLNALESLDLSSNQLDGTIPVELVNLTFLEFLNLSKNHLVGSIPRDRHFDTFGNDSYIGNSELCGFPLSKDCGNTNTPPSSTHLGFEQEFDSEFFDGFTWKAVLLGYGCGLVLGLAVGCLMFLTGKPRWFIDIVDQTYKLRKRRWKLIHIGT